MSATRNRRGAMVGLLAIALGASCQDHEFPPPDRGERILDAESRFAEISFDSIAWETDSARTIEGNIVYASTCRRCHGSLGEGGTEYARSRDLDVPSLLEPEWPLHGDVHGIRQSVFVGHLEGMPTFGVSSLSLREIDAAAWYVSSVLRADLAPADTTG